MEYSSNRENKFLVFLLFYVIVLSVFVGNLSSFLSSKNKNHSKENNNDNKVLVDNKTKENILGWGGRNYEAPTIYVTSGKGYAGGGVIPLSSTDEPAVYFTGGDFSGEAQVGIYEANQEILLNYLVHDKDNKQLKTTPDVNNLKLISSLNVRISSGYGSENKTLLPISESGIWLLEVKTGNNKNYAIVIRSNFAVLVKEADNRYIFWGQNLKTKRSISSGSLKLYSLLDGIKQLADTGFSGEGISSWALDPQADIAIATVGEDQALIPINLRYLDKYNYRPFTAKQIDTKYFVFTDRPLYGPGDKVYFKAVIRDDDDARYSIPQGGARAKIFRDGDEKNPVFEKTYPVSSMGTIDGEFRLPDDAKVGDYQLRVAMTPDRSSDLWEWENVAYFQVEYFRKPEYSVDISVSERELIEKDHLVFDIEGGYFSGQPLVGQTVKYTVTRGSYYDFEFSADSGYYDNYYYGWYGSTPEIQGEAVLNSAGKATVDIETGKILSDGKNKVYSVTVTYDNGSGNPGLARKNILVYSGEFDIFRTDFGYGSQVNKQITIPIKLVPHFNAKVSSIPLSVRIHRENWVASFDSNQKYPQYTKEQEDFPSFNLTSDSNGEAEISFLPTKVGSYTFKVEGTDLRGNNVSKDFYTWVTDKDYWFNYGQYDNELTIKAEKTKYLPGEKVNFTISSTIPDRDVFLAFERGLMHSYQIVKLQARSGSANITLLDSDIPNIFASVNSFSNFTLDTGSEKVIVSAESKRVVVNVTADKKKYGPGETVWLNIETKDVAGNPLSAQTTVWAVDKAIFELVDANPAKIFDTFWRERWDETQNAHSLQGIIVPTAEMGGCFSSDTQILMADGTLKEINKMLPGDFILTRKSEADKSLTKAKIKNVSSAQENGQLIINGNLKVTVDHFLWVNNNWKQAGSVQIGDKLLGFDGKEVAVSSIEWQSGKFTVYNLEIDKNHTFFAQGVWVHNQKGGGGGARKIFKDSAYWNPSVVTDSFGRAKISFKLPDNLTTWVIAGLSVTENTKVGQNTSEIVVSQDTVIRPILPNILRIGDRTMISALAQNFTELDRNFDIKLEFDSGEVVKSTYQGVLVKAGESKEFKWGVNAQKENPKAKLVFSLTSTDDSKQQDIVTQAIPVIPFGYTQKSAEVGEDSKQYSIKLSSDTSKEKTKITLSLASNLTDSLFPAMKYLVSYPYGCVEQTTSSFVPAIIAKNNPDLFSGEIEGKNIDDIVNKGIFLLESLQQSEGGWNWWREGNSNAFKTVYVVEYLIKAQTLGYKISEQILSNARYFLERDQSYSLSSNQTVYDSYPVNVVKTYGLTYLNSGKRKALLSEFDSLSPDILSIAVLANIRNGYKDPQTNGLNKLISLGKSQRDSIFWYAGEPDNYGSKEASTALAIRAMLAGGAPRSTIADAVRFLTRNRMHDYWANTFGTAQTIQALVDYSKTENENTPQYTYIILLDGNQIAKGDISSPKQKIKDIIISVKEIKPEGSTLMLKKVGDGQIYSTLQISEFKTNLNATAENHGLLVKRQYVNEKGEEYTIGVGDSVKVILTVSGLETGTNYGIIADELPAGLIPINQQFKNEQNIDPYDYNYLYSYPEITQNGAVFQLYQMKSGPVNYIYRARAVSEGNFSIPPAEALLMYAPEVWGISAVQQIQITKNAQVIPEKLFKKALPQMFDKTKKNPLLFVAALIIGILVIVLAVFLNKKKFSKTGHPDLPPPPPSMSV